jgi:hypothetical protein
VTLSDSIVYSAFSAGILLLLVSRRPRDEILPDALFAQEAGGDRFAVVSCNRPEELEAISCQRRGAHLKLSKGLHLWDGHLPRPDSRVHVAVLDAAEATLIRDLWSTLPLATGASFALGFFLDGQVFGVSSYDNRRLSLGKTADLSEIFGITIGRPVCTTMPVTPSPVTISATVDVDAGMSWSPGAIRLDNE